MKKIIILTMAALLTATAGCEWFKKITGQQEEPKENEETEEYSLSAHISMLGFAPTEPGSYIEGISIKYSIENTGNVAIDYYGIGFDITFKDGKTQYYPMWGTERILYHHWDVSLPPKKQKSFSTVVQIEYQTVACAAVSVLEIANEQYEMSKKIEF